jgi:hypothetical protein
MKAIVFVTEKFSRKLHTIIALLNMDGNLYLMIGCIIPHWMTITAARWMIIS